MTDVIKDGTGSGFQAKVDSENNLRVRAIQRSELAHALDEGRTWNIGSGFLTLTNDSQTPLLYIRNTGIIHLEVDLYVLLTKASTGGDGSDGLVEVLRNPNGGTIVTDEAAAAVVNTNFGSANEPTIDAYTGGTSKTVTGYDATMRSKVGAENRLLLGILTKLPKGASLCVAYTPPAGNSSMEVEAIVEMYEEHE
jgi:hypothetical protein